MDPDFDFYYDALTIVRKMNEKLKARGRRQRWDIHDGLALRFALGKLGDKMVEDGLLATSEPMGSERKR